MGLGEQLDDAGVRRGHHAVPVDLDDAVPHTHAPALRDAAPEEAADLEGPAGATAAQAARARGPPHTPPGPGWGLTMPSSTQKPSCWRAWGRRMMAVVTGGQWTMLRVTTVCDFSSCAGQVLWALWGLQGPARPPSYTAAPWGLSLPTCEMGL